MNKTENKPPPALPKARTGVDGLDEITGGGPTALPYPLLSWACSAVAATAAIALVGKLLDIRLLASGVPGSIPMAPSTACALIFLAAALHPSLPWSRFGRARIGLLLPVFIIPVPVIAKLAALYVKGGWNSIVSAGPFDPWTLLWVMSPITAGLFFVVGACAAVYLARGRGVSCLAAAWGANVSAACAFIFLLGYAYGVPLFYGGRIIPMAATTAGCFLILSAAILSEVSRRVWPWDLFQGESLRARMMRSVLPIFIGFVLLDGFWDSRWSVANSPLISAAILIVNLPFLVYLVARISASLDASVVAAETALSESEEKLSRVFEYSPAKIAICTIDGKIIDVNRAFEDFLGFSREEMRGKSSADLGIISQEELRRLLARGQPAGASLRCVEVAMRARGGGRLVVLLSMETIAIGGQLHHIATLEDITERNRVEVELKRLKTAIEQATEFVVITDLAGTILYVNPVVEKATGYSREEVLGKNPRMFKSGQQDKAFYRELWETISSGRTWKGLLMNKRKDGVLVTNEVTISPVRDAEGKIFNYVAVNRDVTENVRLEGELRQSQKMESVGRLAGGVAHDFNNILTAINGYTGFALAGLTEGDQRRDDLKEVLLASGRATRLTRQLLAFSRKQILNPQVLDINAAVGESVNMLRRLIGEDVKFETRLAAQPCLSKVDAGQIEQVFLNLAVNARDAMSKGGTLTFETEIVSATETFMARHPEISHRSCVCLSVRDTGCGMSDEVKRHLFEPFFTTKEKGKGTGLGLSMVYGIVKQSGGDIEVESAPGLGTIFRIYFPQIIAENQDKDKDKDKEKDKDVVTGGNETVLFVEDEDGLRRLGVRALKAAGYDVLSATDGLEALAVLERHGRAVDLLVTDVVMPSMSGRQLAQAAAAKKMVRRTLFVSGFTDDAIVQHGVLEPGLAFMYKPFSPDALLCKMREVLDGPADKAKA